MENVPVVLAVLDKGHQSKRTRRAGGRLLPGRAQTGRGNTNEFIRPFCRLT